MRKLKLKVVLVPVQFADIPSSNLESSQSRRFLHLTDHGSDLGEVCDELTKRYIKLYPDDEKLSIISLQDEDKCDLDPDFQVNDVFNLGDIIRVIIENDIQNLSNSSNQLLVTGAENTPAVMRLVDLNKQTQSTPLYPPAPVLTQDSTFPSSSRKRTKEFFETTNENIPCKAARRTVWSTRNGSFMDSNVSEIPLTPKLNILKIREQQTFAAPTKSQNLDIDDDVNDTNISLPPPENGNDLSIPQKRNSTVKPNENALPGKKRITSGMLSMPPHAQLEKEDINHERSKLMRPNELNVSLSTELDSELQSQSDSNSNSESSVRIKPNLITNSSEDKVEEGEGEKNSDNKSHVSFKEQDKNDSSEFVESLTKTEIMNLFKNGMKIPSRLQNKLHNESSKSGKARNLSALMKNLEIDMVNGLNIVLSTEEKRATRAAAKRAAEAVSKKTPKRLTKAMRNTPRLGEEFQEKKDSRASKTPDLNNSVPGHSEKRKGTVHENNEFKTKNSNLLSNNKEVSVNNDKVVLPSKDSDTSKTSTSIPILRASNLSPDNVKQETTNVNLSKPNCSKESELPLPVKREKDLNGKGNNTNITNDLSLKTKHSNESFQPSFIEFNGTSKLSALFEKMKLFDDKLNSLNKKGRQSTKSDSPRDSDGADSVNRKDKVSEPQINTTILKYSEKDETPNATQINATDIQQSIYTNDITESTNKSPKVQKNIVISNNNEAIGFEKNQKPISDPSHMKAPILNNSDGRSNTIISTGGLINNSNSNVSDNVKESNQSVIGKGLATNLSTNDVNNPEPNINSNLPKDGNISEKQSSRSNPTTKKFHLNSLPPVECAENTTDVNKKNVKTTPLDKKKSDITSTKPDNIPPKLKVTGGKPLNPPYKRAKVCEIILTNSNLSPKVAVQTTKFNPKQESKDDISQSKANGHENVNKLVKEPTKERKPISTNAEAHSAKEANNPEILNDKKIQLGNFKPALSDSSSDEISSSESENDDSDENEHRENKRPRLAADVPSSAFHRVNKTENNPVSQRFNADKPVQQAKIEEINIQDPEKLSEKLVEFLKYQDKSNIKKPILTSLSDLALRGVPDVESTSSVNLAEKNGKRVTDDSESSDDESSDEESSYSSASESDSDSESDDDNSDKFINIKKLKKGKPKKVNGGFSALMKDARRF